jgi:hypothetical protein
VKVRFGLVLPMIGAILGLAGSSVGDEMVLDTGLALKLTITGEGGEGWRQHFEG